MEHGPLVSSFVLLFLAEMGDKTQLMAMTLAHRYRPAPVVAGTFVAFLVLDLIAVLLGEGLARVVPRDVVLLAAAALFILFAYRSWRDSDEDEPQVDEAAQRRAFVTTFTLIFVAELGDKTQLALVALAAESGELWSVFVGGTLALWAVSLIGILVGGTVLRKIPKVWVHRAAALLFLLFGLLALAQFGLDRAGIDVPWY
jgi:putative Ca2+/H+ antiporter (TMEM165/GDT1 family)